MWQFFTTRRSIQRTSTTDTAQYGSLQIVLWTLWTLAVAATAWFTWHVANLAQQPVSFLGMSIHCAVVGLAGLVVLTLVEMRLEPWRFLE